VAWNLTRRCNLACAHCYIAAGSWHESAGELDTGECLRVLDQLLELNPNPMLILSGGEPLLRDDLETLAQHAADGGATVVVGTNGTRLTDARIESLMGAGVQGVALSVDSLDARYHDRFRHAARHEGGQVTGAATEGLADTLAAVGRLQRHRLDFVVQTTVTRGNRQEVGRLAAWSADVGAVSFNLYFLVATGRAEGMEGLDPAENDDVLRELVSLERTYRGRMMIRSKCQPQLMRHVLEGDPESPLLNYATRCPCGVHYCRITPEGKVTPCPYSPVVAGDLRSTSFRQIWEDSPVFGALRAGGLGGRCGRCEYREVCGGCRARAAAETGDLLGEDPSCAYQPSGEAPLVEPRRTVTYGAARETALPWSDEARARLARVPSFVRAVVSERVERFARERGRTAVDLEVMAEVRRQMPVDFSRRLPFFLSREDQA
jgi:radical SAM protein with 4Fe4S-binding SPASM domain